MRVIYWVLPGTTLGMFLFLGFLYMLLGNNGIREGIGQLITYVIKIIFAIGGAIPVIRGLIRLIETILVSIIEFSIKNWSLAVIIGSITTTMVISHFSYYLLIKILFIGIGVMGWFSLLTKLFGKERLIMLKHWLLSKGKGGIGYLLGKVIEKVQLTIYGHSKDFSKVKCPDCGLTYDATANFCECGEINPNTAKECPTCKAEAVKKYGNDVKNHSSEFAVYADKNHCDRCNYQFDKKDGFFKRRIGNKVGKIKKLGEKDPETAICHHCKRMILKGCTICRCGNNPQESKFIAALSWLIE